MALFKDRRRQWLNLVKPNDFSPFLLGFCLVCLFAVPAAAQIMDSLPTNAVGWGYNGFGQLGRGYESFSDGPDFATVLWPSDEFAGDETDALEFESIAVGVDHVIAIQRTTRRVYTWGSNNFHKLGTSYGAGDDAGLLINRNHPTLVRSEGGEPIEAAFVAAGRNFSFVLDTAGILWTNGVTSNLGTMIMVSGLTGMIGNDTIGLACEISVCAMWNSFRIYCFEKLAEGGITNLHCNPPGGNMTSIETVALISEGTNDFTLAVLNDTKLWIGTSNFGNGRGAFAESGCTATSEWCEMEPNLLSRIPSKIAFCRPNMTVILLEDGDIFIADVDGIGNRVETFARDTLPLLNASDIACVGQSIFAVHVGSDPSDPFFDTTVVISFEPPSVALRSSVLMARPEIIDNPSRPLALFGLAPMQVHMPFKVAFSSSDGQPGLRLGMMSSTSLNIYALVDKEAIQENLVAYHAVTWGVGDIGQLMTKETPFASYKPSLVTFPWALDYGLDDSIPCWMPSNRYLTSFNCKDTFYAHFGAVILPSLHNIQTRTFPTIGAGSYNKYLMSTSLDSFVMIQNNNETFGMSVANAGLTISDPSNPVSWDELMNITAVYLKCGTFHCGIMDSDNILYLVGSNDSLAYPPSPTPYTNYFSTGQTLWNSTLTVKNTSLLALGTAFTALIKAGTEELVVFGNGQSFTSSLYNAIQLAAGERQLLVLDGPTSTTGATIHEFLSNGMFLESLATEPSHGYSMLFNITEIAAVGDTNFALADRSATDTTISVWSWISQGAPNSPTEVIGYLDRPLNYRAWQIPQMIPLPHSDAVPISLCQTCRGSTMAIRINALAATHLTSPNRTRQGVLTKRSDYSTYQGEKSGKDENLRNSELSPDEGLLSGGGRFSVGGIDMARTCFGDNTRGACDTSASVSNYQFAFLPTSVSDRKWRIMAKSSTGTCWGVDDQNIAFSWAEGDFPLDWPYNNLGLPTSDPWLLKTSSSDTMLSYGFSILGVPMPKMSGIAFLAATSSSVVYVLHTNTSEVRLYDPVGGGGVIGSTQEPILQMATHPSRDDIMLIHASGVTTIASDTTSSFELHNPPVTSVALGRAFHCLHFGANRTANFLRSGHPVHTSHNVTAISLHAGTSHILYILEDGSVEVVSSSNTKGQIGSHDPMTLPYGLYSARHVFDGQTVAQVAATGDTSYVLLENGKLFVWGWNGPYNLFGFPYSLLQSDTVVSPPWNAILPLPAPDETRINKIVALANTVHLEWGLPIPIPTTPPTSSPSANTPITCPQPPPSGFSTSPICSPDGFWIIIGNVESPGGVIVVTSPVLIEGNVTIPGSTTIQVPLDALNGDNSILKVNGCATIDGAINVTITLEELEEIEQQGKPKIVLLLDAKCGAMNGQVNAVGPKSCKKVSTTQTSTNDNVGNGYTLSATFRVSSSGCRLWWIILVSVLGGIILLAVIVILLATFTPLRHVIRPHAKRAESTKS